jgi:hypothetical protein
MGDSTETVSGVGQVNCGGIDEILLGAPVLTGVGRGYGLDAFRQR